MTNETQYAPTPAASEQFTFHGNAKEWFGIWIVNLLLSIVTLGIYSAWAKVRTNKYFYQNTWVAGRNFNYHATGRQILIGRLIVVAGFIVISVASAVSPILYLILIIALMAVFPYLIVRGARFNARNTSWANVRFDFDGAIGAAYRIFLLYPLLVVFSLYLAFPFLDRATQRFGITGHSLGKARLKFESGIGPFYGAFFAAGIFAVIGIVGFMWAGWDFFMRVADPYASQVPSPDMMVGLLLGYILLIVAMVFASAIYIAILRNHIFASTHLGEANHGFKSTITTLSLLGIMITNFLMVVCSLGFLLPWAQVRMHRYLTTNTFIVPNGTLDDFVGDMVADGNAIGDAYGDIEGVDLGIGI